MKKSLYYKPLSIVILFFVLTISAIGQEVPTARQIDEYGKIVSNDEKKILDHFNSELQSDPSSSGYVIVFGTPKVVKQRVKYIKQYWKSLGFDLSRLQIVEKISNSTMPKTQLWFVPAGAELPKS
jgi:hypothetical protein